MNFLGLKQLLLIIVPEYDIVHPYRSDDEGKFSSFKLHDPSQEHHDVNKYFSMRGLGHNLHLKLSEADDIRVPGAKVSIIEADGSKSNHDLKQSNYYDGHVVNNPGSKVVLAHDAEGLV